MRLALVFCFLFGSPAFAGEARDVYEKAAPGVVLILGADSAGQGSAGTGSIIKEGYVLTNAHVVMNKAGKPYRRLNVYLKPKEITGDNKNDLRRRLEAKVIAFSPAEQLDLALLEIGKIESTHPVISLVGSADVKIGDDVYAIGHPEQGGLFTLTTGVISTKIANLNNVPGKDAFQTNASVNRGNSGGPLLNTRGEMIGINTAIARRGKDGVAITGVNFSIKSEVVRDWLLNQNFVLPKPKAGSFTNADTRYAVGVSTTSFHVPARVRPSVPKVKEPMVPKVAPVTAKAPVAKKAQAAPEVANPTKPVILRSDDLVAGTGSRAEGERVIEGKLTPLPKDVKANIVKDITILRPFNLDELRKKQMQELENLMDSMRGNKRRVKGIIRP